MIENFTRRPDLDRPAVVFDSGSIIPQQVGFENQYGTGIQVSLAWAKEHNMLNGEEVLERKMPIREYVVFQKGINGKN